MKSLPYKDNIKTKPDLNLIIEILVEKVDIKISTIKDMLKSLRDNSLHQIRQVHPY